MLLQTSRKQHTDQKKSSRQSYSSQVPGSYNGGKTNKQQQKTFRCNRCSWCKKLVESDTFTSNTNNKSYNIYHKMTCTSPWVIYLAECGKCKKQYVSKSKPNLNIRFNNNRSHMKHNVLNCKLVENFAKSTECDFEKRHNHRKNRCCQRFRKIKRGERDDIVTKGNFLATQA